MMDSNSRTVRLHVAPAFLVRYAGVPMNRLTGLTSAMIRGLLVEVLQADSGIAQRQEQVSQLLFAAVGEATEREQRRGLLALRRAIFTERPVSARVAAWTTTLAIGDRTIIEQQILALARREQLVARIDECWSNEVNLWRAKFRAQLHDVDYVLSLQLATPGLASVLEQYLVEPPLGRGGSLTQVERGLLRYFSRMATKSTPFARFCAVGRGAFDRSPLVGSAQLIGTPTEKTTRVRLNKRLFDLFWRAAISVPELSRGLPVLWNETVEERGSKWILLTRTGVQETFRHIESNELLHYIRRQVINANGRRTIESLVEGFLADATLEASKEEATAFCEGLVRLGLLRYSHGIPELEADWEEPLAGVLERTGNALGIDLGSTLRSLRRQADQLACSDKVRRPVGIEAMKQALLDTFADQRIARPLPSEPIVWEDATASATMSLSGTCAPLEKLAELAELLLPMSETHALQATLRQFFENRYGTAVDRVPVLEFYEEFYRHHFKHHLEVEQGLSTQERMLLQGAYNLQNPFNLESVRRVHTARESLCELLRARWESNPAASEIVLRRDDVLGCSKTLPPETLDGRSIAVFATPAFSATESNLQQLYVRGAECFAGYGKYYSRFLDLLPGDFLAQVRADNEGNSNEWQFAEIEADGAFNGNLHPSLVRTSIRYPLSASGTSGTVIDCGHLCVTRDTSDANALCLLNTTTDARVIPLDLGFLNPRMRPPLFQLLARFGLPTMGFIRLPDTWLRAPQALATQEVPLTIQYRPRVTYEGVVAISRRQWMVPRALWPVRRAGEAEPQYFVRLARWRTLHGIPERVYVRVIPGSARNVALPPVLEPTESDEGAEDEQIDEEAALQSPARAPVPDSDVRADSKAPPPAAQLTKRRNWRKPQFVDFGDPSLVSLFERMPSGLSRFTMCIEEELPRSGDRIRSNEGEIASELVLQLYPSRSACS
ncbi:MAG: lantibiotic dehydratase [Gemmatimonadetes bacterium]|nr:lantibiotic dehydratase [Gemmatimonadota bacterium]